MLLLYHIIFSSFFLFGDLNLKFWVQRDINFWLLAVSDKLIETHIFFQVMLVLRLRKPLLSGLLGIIKIKNFIFEV